MPMRRNTIEDFWRRVDVRGADECWGWLGQKDRRGYGRFSINGKKFLAHRIALHGVAKKQDKSVVCHSCDNPSCVNPSHLFVGTQADNVQDMLSKGRNRPNPPSGERHHNSKLTEHEVFLIKQSRATQVQLAEIFGVTQANISEIRRGRTWKHVQP